MSSGDHRVDPVATVLAAARSDETMEIFLEDATSRTVTVVDGEAESSEDEQQRGAGIRIFHEGRVGFGFTSDLSTDGLHQAVESARALSAVTRHDQANRAPVATPATPPGETEDAGSAPFSVRLDLARQVESAAQNAAPGIKTRAATVVETTGRVRIAHSGGLDCVWGWRRAWASIEVVAERGGKLQTGYETRWAHTLDGVDGQQVGTDAAAQALRKFGATRPPTGRHTVVLDPRVTAGLFQALAGALSGKAVARQRSLFANRVGEAVAAQAVTLVDDGAETAGFDAAPFDGEGVPSSRAVLIQEGTLRGFLHDTYTAIRANTTSTGHAVRDDHSSLPGAGTRNVHLVPTGPDRAALLAAAGAGIYVDEVMGLHTVDPVSGDFSLGAAGRVLAGGEPGAALEGFAISGNVLRLLASVETVADDLRFFPGAAGGSTVLLREVLVSGH